MKIPLKRDDEIRLVDINDIQYLDIYKKIISLHTADATYQTLSTLNDWYAFLSEYGFEKLSQSSVVNLKRIETFDPETNRVFFSKGNNVGVSIPNIPKIKYYSKKK